MYSVVGLGSVVVLDVILGKPYNLRPYHYFKHLLTELPKLCDDEGNIDSTKLDYLLPWSTELPKECRKPRR